MRRIVLTAALAGALLLAGLWAAGALDGVAAWAETGQRRFQNAMAGALRAVRGGAPGAVAGLLGICFAYGFFHAVGPGHGKVLIGGYGAGSRVRLLPLAGIALAASLAQATTAVALVYAGVLALDWSRDRMIGVTEAVMAPVSYAAIGLIGLWLVWRGGRALWRRARPAAGAHGTHAAPGANTSDAAAGHFAGPAQDPAACGECGHRHGPTVAEVAGVRGWRDAALLVGAIALRPCTGALFVLILTLNMGIAAAGIAGAYVMGLGTASVTVAVAALSVLAREGALGGAAAGLPGSGVARAAAPVLEVVAGGFVVAAAATLLMRAV